MKRHLLWKLFFSFFAVTVLTLLAITFYFSHTFRIRYEQQIASDLQSRLQLVIENLTTSLDSGTFDGMSETVALLSQAAEMRITVMLPNGQVIAESHQDPSQMKNHSNRPEFRQAVVQEYGMDVRISPTLGQRLMYIASAVRKDQDVIAVVRGSVPISGIEQGLHSIYSHMFEVGVIVVIAVAVIRWFISRSITSPLERMRHTVQQFARGDLSHRVDVPRSSELADLATTFNDMAQQLQQRMDTILRDRNENQAVLSSMVEGVIAVDTNGYILSINKAAAYFLQVEPKKATGKHIEEVTRNSELEALIRRTIDSAETTEGMLNLVRENADVPVASYQVHGAGLTDEQGQKRGAVIVLHDMTQVKRLENIRRDFVANVSHELKTPITSIKGFVETLQEGYFSDPDQVQRFLAIIAKHADRLNAIVEDLLALSHLEQGGDGRKISYTNIDIRHVLDAAIELSDLKANQKNISLEMSCPKGLHIRANDALLEQAITNLIDNAIKYSDTGGVISIQAADENNEVIISVADNGCGIPQKHLTRIFERFYVVDKARSRKLGGTGLGLAIVKHISQVHGGYVTVHSEVGQGSTFKIHLPRE